MPSKYSSLHEYLTRQSLTNSELVEILNKNRAGLNKKKSSDEYSISTDDSIILQGISKKETHWNNTLTTNPSENKIKKSTTNSSRKGKKEHTATGSLADFLSKTCPKKIDNSRRIEKKLSEGRVKAHRKSAEDQISLCRNLAKVLDEPRDDTESLKTAWTLENTEVYSRYHISDCDSVTIVEDEVERGPSSRCSCMIVVFSPDCDAQKEGNGSVEVVAIFIPFMVGYNVQSIFENTFL